MRWYLCYSTAPRATLTLQILPHARTSAVVGRYGDALKVKITAPALDDKAKRELIDFLHQWFKLPFNNIKIRHRTRGRRTIVELNQGPDPRLRRYAPGQTPYAKPA